MKNIYTREEVVEILKECDDAIDFYLSVFDKYSNAVSRSCHPRWDDGYPMHPPQKPTFSDGGVFYVYKKIKEVFEE